MSRFRDENETRRVRDASFLPDPSPSRRRAGRSLVPLSSRVEVIREKHERFRVSNTRGRLRFDLAFVFHVVLLAFASREKERNMARDESCRSAEAPRTKRESVSHPGRKGRHRHGKKKKTKKKKMNKSSERERDPNAFHLLFREEHLACVSCVFVHFAPIRLRVPSGSLPFQTPSRFRFDRRPSFGSSTLLFLERKEGENKKGTRTNSIGDGIETEPYPLPLRTGISCMYRRGSMTRRNRFLRELRRLREAGDGILFGSWSLDPCDRERSLS